jgi:hypothetical protein
MLQKRVSHQESFLIFSRQIVFSRHRPELQRLDFLRLALQRDVGDGAAVVEPGVAILG